MQEIRHSCVSCIRPCICYTFAYILKHSHIIRYSCRLVVDFVWCIPLRQARSFRSFNCKRVVIKRGNSLCLPCMFSESSIIYRCLKQPVHCLNCLKLYCFWKYWMNIWIFVITVWLVVSLFICLNVALWMLGHVLHTVDL